MSNFIEPKIGSWFLIANPFAGNKKFSKQWKEIQQLLKAKEIDYSFAFTKYSKHEIELVQNAIQQGYRNIISVGGDGTLHYVVHGIMAQRYIKTSDITIGVIPVGTANDWVKTYNIPNSVTDAIDLIFKKKTILQDIGVIITADDKTRYFNNIAGLGFDGYIVNSHQKFKKLGSLSYLFAGIYGLLFYKKNIFKIYIDTKVLEINCLMILFGNCKYFGNGIQLTKYVDSADGFLDISIIKNITLLDLFINIKKIFNGTIVEHPKFETYRTKEIKVISENISPYIQADGELVGAGNVTVKIVEKAINFIIK